MDEETVEKEGRRRRFRSLSIRIEHHWIEIAAAALMALSTMMSAFSAYQSAE